MNPQKSEQLQFITSAWWPRHLALGHFLLLLKGSFGLELGARWTCEISDSEILAIQLHSPTKPEPKPLQGHWLVFATWNMCAMAAGLRPQKEETICLEGAENKLT